MATENKFESHRAPQPVGNPERNESSPFSEWLTAAEAAEHLKVKVRTLLLWVRQGKIQAYALSGTKRRIWRFRREDLDATLLSKPVVSCGPPAVLKQKGRLD
jgi:excisionase family DNA binding protein